MYYLFILNKEIYLLQKNLIELQKESLIKDFNGLNLNKYIGEVVSIRSVKDL